MQANARTTAPSATSAVVPPATPGQAAPPQVAPPAASQVSRGVAATIAAGATVPGAPAPPATAIQPSANVPAVQTARTAPVTAAAARPAPTRVVSAKAAERPPVMDRPVNTPAPSKPDRIEKGRTPLLLVTEVTYHDVPERRSAQIQVAGGRPRVVHEGDSLDGFKVNQILAGSVEIEAGGGPVVLDVGESLTLTVSAPDFH